jgi:MFS family permease
MAMVPRAEVRTARPAGLFYGFVVAAAGALMMVLVFSVHYSFGIFFKPVLSEFGWTRAATAGAFSLVWVVQGLLAAVMGGLNDRVGPRFVLTVCGALMGTGYLLMSQVGALWQLYVIYGVIIGAGLGGTFVPLTSTTARWFIAKRGLMTGLVTAGVGVGAFIGPPIANQLIAAHDWRISYALFGTVVLVGVVLLAQLLKRDPADAGERPYGYRDAASNQPAPSAIGLLLPAALRTHQFWLVALVFFCYGFPLSAVLLHLAPHATDVGISPASGANILATLGGASVVGKIALGRVADAIGNKHVYLISFGLMALSLLSLIGLHELWMFFAFAALFGFAYGGLATAHSPLVAWLFGMRQHGLVFGVLFNGWTLGCATGPLVAGYLYDRSHNYEIAFSICAAMAVAGLVLTAALTPGRLLEPPPAPAR